MWNGEFLTYSVWYSIVGTCISKNSVVLSFIVCVCGGGCVDVCGFISESVCLFISV